MGHGSVFWLPESTCSVHKVSPSVGLLTALVFPSSQGVCLLDERVQCGSADLIWVAADSGAGSHKSDAYADG